METTIIATTTRRRIKPIDELLEAIAKKNPKGIIPWPELAEALQQNFNYSSPALVWPAVRIRSLITRKQLFPVIAPQLLSAQT
jgi:hypothetical protein